MGVLDLSVTGGLLAVYELILFVAQDIFNGENLTKT